MSEEESGNESADELGSDGGKDSENCRKRKKPTKTKKRWVLLDLKNQTLLTLKLISNQLIIDIFWTEVGEIYNVLFWHTL